jgi:uncharacterized membrane protein YgcG
VHAWVVDAAVEGSHLAAVLELLRLVLNDPRGYDNDGAAAAASHPTLAPASSAASANNSNGSNNDPNEENSNEYPNNDKNDDPPDSDSDSNSNRGRSASGSFVPLGFAFSHDVRQIDALAARGGERPFACRCPVVDVQSLATTTAAAAAQQDTHQLHHRRGSPLVSGNGGGSGGSGGGCGGGCGGGYVGGVGGATGQLPGLGKVAEAWLGRAVDKAEQTSDWDRRPLSKDQLHYAAADAAVLVQIAHSLLLAGLVGEAAER